MTECRPSVNHDNTALSNATIEPGLLEFDQLWSVNEEGICVCTWAGNEQTRPICAYFTSIDEQPACIVHNGNDDELSADDLRQSTFGGQYEQSI